MLIKPLLVSMSFGILLLLPGADRVGQVVDEKTRQADGQMTSAPGRRVAFHGRPTDGVFSKDGRFLYVKDSGNLLTIDVATAKVVGELNLPGGASQQGILVSESGSQLLITTASDSVVSLSLADPSHPKLQVESHLGGRYPCGMAYDAQRNSVWICLSMANTVVQFDTSLMKVVASVNVGVAPAAITIDPSTSRAFVLCQGGVRPAKSDETAPSAGTPVTIDHRGIASAGSISIIDLRSRQVAEEVACGRQPSSVILDQKGDSLYVSCANDDRVEIYDKNSMKRLGQIDFATPSGHFGAMPTGLILRGHDLYTTVAGLSCVAVTDVADPQAPKPRGVFEADWFPVAFAAHGETFAVFNTKGLGSRANLRPAKEGHLVSDSLGSVTLYTAAPILHTLMPPSIPPHVGESSPIKHVIYVIKENRTYDQVFGDIATADGDASLCVFGEKITPNQHALAQQFGVLDNYYCNGVLSADGHSWATEGNVTPYLERMFGGFSRSYTFGDDPMTYSSSGFIWDALMAHGISFRNYGEFDYAESTTKLTSYQIMATYFAGKPQTFTQNIGIKNVREHSCRNYPGWNTAIPDQLRIDRFLDEFRQYEKNGDLPQFVIVYLPQDHTGGPASPKAHVADNDLAVGRLVDAISHSRFWKDSVLFINEDDPSAGFDHVDGHRSTCLVVSPYTRGKKTISDFYNQSSVLHTILQIFGCESLNEQISRSPLMSNCFNAEPNLAPFDALKNNIPLFEPKSQTAPRLNLQFHEAQTGAEMEALNREIWRDAKMPTPYPSDVAGAHGRGLSRRGLRAVSTDD